MADSKKTKQHYPTHYKSLKAYIKKREDIFNAMREEEGIFLTEQQWADKRTEILESEKPEHVIAWEYLRRNAEYFEFFQKIRATYYDYLHARQIYLGKIDKKQKLQRSWLKENIGSLFKHEEILRKSQEVLERYGVNCLIPPDPSGDKIILPPTGKKDDARNVSSFFAIADTRFPMIRPPNSRNISFSITKDRPDYFVESLGFKKKKAISEDSAASNIVQSKVDHVAEAILEEIGLQSPTDSDATIEDVKTATKQKKGRDSYRKGYSHPTIIVQFSLLIDLKEQLKKAEEAIKMIKNGIAIEDLEKIGLDAAPKLTKSDIEDHLNKLELYDAVMLTDLHIRKQFNDLKEKFSKKLKIEEDTVLKYIAVANSYIYRLEYKKLINAQTPLKLYK